MVRGVFVLAAIVALGVAPGPADAGDGCVRVWVTSTPATSGGAESGFSATEILDLNFSALLPPQTHERPLPSTVELKVFTPNGHLYQTATVPVEPPGSRKQQRNMKGYRFPRPTRQARVHDERSGRWNRVDMPPFPVAGTAIVNSSLYGTWRVEAWPAGSDTACQASFQIRP